MTTAERIARALKRNDMKPADLATELDVTRSTVHGWLHATHEPNLESLRGMAKVLKCEVADLIGTSA